MGFAKACVLLSICAAFVSLPLDANARQKTGTISFSGVGDGSSCPTNFTPAQEAVRTRQKYVDFGGAFAGAPAVFLSVTMLDAYTGRNIRYLVRPDSVSPYGFVLTFGTWCDTYIYSVTISWLALEG